MFEAGSVHMGWRGHWRRARSGTRGWSGRLSAQRRGHLGREFPQLQQFPHEWHSLSLGRWFGPARSRGNRSGGLPRAGHARLWRYRRGLLTWATIFNARGEKTFACYYEQNIRHSPVAGRSMIEEMARFWMPINGVLRDQLLEDLICLNTEARLLEKPGFSLLIVSVDQVKVFQQVNSASNAVSVKDCSPGQGAASLRAVTPPWVAPHPKSGGRAWEVNTPFRSFRDRNCIRYAIVFCAGMATWYGIGESG